MPRHELERFLATWDAEAQNTLKVLRALPKDRYDYRPDPEARSLGEMAWHLAEVDAFGTHGFETGQFRIEVKPPNLERPRTIEALAPGYERVHAEAAARVRKLKPEDVDRSVTFFGGREIPIRDILWGAVLHHLIHHRAQLMLLCRQSGGAPPGIYGPNREEMAAMRAQAQGR